MHHYLRYSQFVSFSRAIGSLGLAIALAGFSSDAFAHSDALLVNVGGQVVVGTAEDIDGPNEAYALDAGLFESILRSGFAPPTLGPASTAPSPSRTSAAPTIRKVSAWACAAGPVAAFMPLMPEASR